MKRHNTLTILLFAIMFALASVSFADPVGPDMAHKAAETYLSNTVSEGAQKPARNAAISRMKEITNARNETLAFIAELENGGFIILSGDTDVEPILGYSTTGEFPYADSRDNILLHLVQNDMKTRLQATPVIEQHERDHVLSNNALWKQYISGERALKTTAESTTVWGPLLTTNWNQTSPFNDVCPIDPHTGERSVVGCVATAMVQILNYWKYPRQMTFDTSDAYEKNGIDIPGDSDALDFPSFDDLNTTLADIRYDGDETEQACISFAAGIRSKMSYSSEGSGASVYAESFQKMGFETAASGYSWTKYKQKVIDDIKLGFPVDIGLTNNVEGGGHMVVFDGYIEGQDLFHVNMGWGEKYNLWYSCPPIYSGYDFQIIDVIIYNIYSPEAEIGSITGRVLSSSRLPLNNAVVTVNPGHYLTVTDANGGFDINLPSGATYTVTAAKTGYTPVTGESVTVTQNTETSVGELSLASSSSPTVAHYLFDGDGSDESGNGFDVFVNTDVAEWVDGVDDQAVSVTDLGYVIDGPGAGLTYPGEGDWTVEAWVNMPDSYSYNTIIEHPSYTLLFSNNKIKFTISDGENSDIIQTDFPVANGEWFHVAAVYTHKKSLELYVNGLLLEKTATHIVPRFVPWESAIICDSWYGEMRIDELRISAKALSPDEFMGTPSTGGITGLLTDSATGETVSGAKIMLSGGDYFAFTNEEGRYTLSKVPAGTKYTLTVEETGYKAYEQTDVEIIADEMVTIDIELVTGIDFAITSVTDVPNDQGRQVRVTWNAHDNDSMDTAEDVITKYSIWRALDDNLPVSAKTASSGSGWDFVCEIPAVQNETYRTIVPTLADSTIVDGLYETVFKLKAHTANPLVHFETESAEGYSVDNLRPVSVGNISVTYLPQAIEISWDASHSGDVSHYEVHKSADPGFVPDASTLAGTTTETVFIDSDPSGDMIYKIAVYDISGNRSVTRYDGQITGVEETPVEFSVSAPYPNPFNSSVTIQYVIPEQCETKITVYDITGREITVIENSEKRPGAHYAVWNGRDSNGTVTASGVYLYKITAGAHVHQGKALFLR